MPAANPRLSITVAPAVATAFAELSELTGNSQSAMIAELLESSLPVFDNMIRLLRAAKSAEAGAIPTIVSDLDSAQRRIEGMLGVVLSDTEDVTRNVEQHAAVKRRGRRSASPPAAPLSGPPPLTGGSRDPKSGADAQKSGEGKPPRGRVRGRSHA